MWLLLLLFATAYGVDPCNDDALDVDETVCILAGCAWYETGGYCFACSNFDWFELSCGDYSMCEYIQYPYDLCIFNSSYPVPGTNCSTVDDISQSDMDNKYALKGVNTTTGKILRTNSRCEADLDGVRDGFIFEYIRTGRDFYEVGNGTAINITLAKNTQFNIYTQFHYESGKTSVLLNIYNYGKVWQCEHDGFGKEITMTFTGSKVQNWITQMCDILIKTIITERINKIDASLGRKYSSEYKSVLNSPNTKTQLLPDVMCAMSIANCKNSPYCHVNETANPDWAPACIPCSEALEQDACEYFGCTYADGKCSADNTDSTTPIIITYIDTDLSFYNVISCIEFPVAMHVNDLSGIPVTCNGNNYRKLNSSEFNGVILVKGPVSGNMIIPVLITFKQNEWNLIIPMNEKDATALSCSELSKSGNKYFINKIGPSDEYYCPELSNFYDTVCVSSEEGVKYELAFWITLGIGIALAGFSGYVAYVVFIK